MGMPSPSTAVERLTPPCFPLYPPGSCPRLLAAARGLLGDAAIHGYDIGQFEADGPVVVGRQRHLPRSLHHHSEEVDPLVALASLAAQNVVSEHDCSRGDPPVSAAEHQDLNQLLEDHPVGYARLVVPEWVFYFPCWRQSGELLPDGLDEVRLDRTGTRSFVGKLQQLSA